MRRAGIACIVPPEGWAPPFALEKGTNGQSMESFRFSIRKQLTSHLCMRVPNTGRATKRAPSRCPRAHPTPAAESLCLPSSGAQEPLQLQDHWLR
jgi:hypothetical protein